MQRRKLEELNLLDDFLFNAMLAYPDTGEAFIRKLLETLFDRKFWASFSPLFLVSSP